MKKNLYFHALFMFLVVGLAVVAQRISLAPKDPQKIFVMHIELSEITSLAYAEGTSRVVIERVNTGWRVRLRDVFPASQVATTLLEDLAHLPAVRDLGVLSDAKTLAEMGLAPAKGLLHIKHGQHTTVFSLGDVDGSGRTQYMQNAQGQVFTVLARYLMPLKHSVNELQDRRVAWLARDHLRQVDIAYRGQTFSVLNHDDALTTSPGNPPEIMPWVESIFRIQVESMADDVVFPPSDDIIELSFQGDMQPAKVRFWHRDDGRVLVESSRSLEPMWLSVQASEKVWEVTSLFTRS